MLAFNRDCCTKSHFSSITNTLKNIPIETRRLTLCVRHTRSVGQSRPDGSGPGTMCPGQKYGYAISTQGKAGFATDCSSDVRLDLHEKSAQTKCLQMSIKRAECYGDILPSQSGISELSILSHLADSHASGEEQPNMRCISIRTQHKSFVVAPRAFCYPEHQTGSRRPAIEVARLWI